MRSTKVGGALSQAADPPPQLISQAQAGPRLHQVERGSLSQLFIVLGKLSPEDRELPCLGLHQSPRPVQFAS